MDSKHSRLDEVGFQATGVIFFIICRKLRHKRCGVPFDPDDLVQASIILPELARWIRWIRAGPSFLASSR